MTNILLNFHRKVIKSVYLSANHLISSVIFISDLNNKSGAFQEQLNIRQSKIAVKYSGRGNLFRPLNSVSRITNRLVTQ